MGSGLILLIIVGAWLAFFVQMALRSETTDVLGTVDRFHDAMRVLSRRQVAGRPREHAPHGRSGPGLDPGPGTPAPVPAPRRTSAVAGPSLAASLSGAGDVAARRREAAAARRARLLTGLAVTAVLTLLGAVTVSWWLLLPHLALDLLLVGLVVHLRTLAHSRAAADQRVAEAVAGARVTRAAHGAVPAARTADGRPVPGRPVPGSPVLGSPVLGSPVPSSRLIGRPVPAAAPGAPVLGAPISGAPVFGASVSGAPVSGAPVFDVPVPSAPVPVSTVQESAVHVRQPRREAEAGSVAVRRPVPVVRRPVQIHVAGVPDRMPPRPRPLPGTVGGAPAPLSVPAARTEQLPAARQVRGAQGEAWSPVPIPAPTYLSAPPAPRRVVDLTRPAGAVQRRPSTGPEVGLHDVAPAVEETVDHRWAVND